MRFLQAIIAFAALAVTSTQAFVFTVWLGDKCTITGARPSDQELLVIPQAVGSNGCMKYETMEYGYNQTLLVSPEDSDPDDDYLSFFPTPDCSGDPLFISPPASDLRERPVAGCSNYAAAGITTMSYMIV